MAHEFKISRRVEFSETDMAGIVHFSNFFRYMEMAESAFLRSLGFSVNMSHFKGQHLGIPRVHANCDFKKPLRFEDEFEVHLRVKEKRTRALTYQFVISKKVNGGLEEAARGAVTLVCVGIQPDGKMSAVPFPEEIASQIEVAPEFRA